MKKQYAYNREQFLLLGLLFLSAFSTYAQQWFGPNNQVGSIGRTGNVGIGTNAPAQRLHVVGNTLVVGSLFINKDGNMQNGELTVQSLNTPAQTSIVQADNTGKLIKSPFSVNDINGNLCALKVLIDNALQKCTGAPQIENKEVYHVGLLSGDGVCPSVIRQQNEGGGQIGIKRDKPICRLDVNGDARIYDEDGQEVSSLEFQVDEGNTYKAVLFGNHPDHNANDNGPLAKRFIIGRDPGNNNLIPYLIFDPNGDQIGINEINPQDQLHVNGNIRAEKKVYALDFVNPSDVRYKKNIQTLDRSLSKINGLRGVNFFWRTEEYPDKHFGKNEQIGFIAQEVEKVFPELVDTDARGYKSVDYAKLTPVLVEAIKEQQKLIEQLQADREALKAECKATADKLSALTERLERLEKASEAMTLNK